MATTLRDKRRRQKSRWKNIPEVGLRFLGTLVFQKGLLTKDSGKAHVMKQAVIKKFSVPNFVSNASPQLFTFSNLLPSFFFQGEELWDKTYSEFEAQRNCPYYKDVQPF